MTGARFGASRVLTLGKRGIDIMRQSNSTTVRMARAAAIAATCLLAPAATAVPQPEAGAPSNEACLRCHPDAQQLGTSVHAGLACVQCHTDVTALPHKAGHAAAQSQPSSLPGITASCGGCHRASLSSYTETYHGRITALGSGSAAKCFDCHGGHQIQRVSDRASPVHPAHRVATCGKCHAGAGKGFATFEPHGTTRDPVRFPGLWMASKLMLVMTAGTFGFFWSHAALWSYRERKERRARAFQPRVRMASAGPGKAEGRAFQRFAPVWRAVHLIVAVCVIVLALTGLSILYADAPFAAPVMRWLGGPHAGAVIHRASALLLMAVLLAQLAYFALHAVRKRASFELFGPDSLAPRLQDLRDIFAMFKWFFAMGPKPVFDRWTYWEKFDYWAPLSILGFIGICGALLWAPEATAAILPGWVFNLATIFHGEAALLAVLFLFTVHLFNNHFRPDKFPLEVVMFTGSMPLERFQREHRLEYNRLLESGKLADHLVPAPSRAAAFGSRVLGYGLIACGMLLLASVLVGALGR